MTHAELEAIIEGIAPVIETQIKTATQRLEREVCTLRDAQVALREQVHAAEARSTALETRLLEQQKAAFESRCVDLEARLLTRGVPDAAIR